MKDKNFLKTIMFMLMLDKDWRKLTPRLIMAGVSFGLFAVIMMIIFIFMIVEGWG